MNVTVATKAIHLSLQHAKIVGAQNASQSLQHSLKRGSCKRRG